MRFGAWIGFLLLWTVFHAAAQRADCPVKNAPPAMTPPGPPPAFVPPMPQLPERLEDLPKTPIPAPPPSVLPAQEGPMRAEEGHLSAIAALAGRARSEPPPADVRAGLVDEKKTKLSAWRFHGYIPDPAWARSRCEPNGNCGSSTRHRVERVFSLDGSTLVLMEWNMSADGASVIATAPQTLRIGKSLGNMNAMVSPSGCASASLTWQGGGKSASLKVVGPRSLEQQEDLLLELAASIAAATSGN